MSNAFPRTLRSLRADDDRGVPWGLLVGAGLLFALVGWALLARITVFERSEAARLEVDTAPHPVEASVAGSVTKSLLALDREVRAGEILVELDSELERLRLEEERARLASLGRQLSRILDQQRAEDASARDGEASGKVELEGARARQRSAAAGADFKREEAERLARTGGAVSQLELLHVQSQRDENQAAAAALALDVERVSRDRRVRDEEARVRREKLAREQAEIEGAERVSRTSIERLEREIERRRLRAPVGGRLGQIVTLGPGATLKEGERIAVVVPSGGVLRIVAELPLTALGRVRSGQPAWLRLDAFPWTAWGSIRARVERVGSEARDGRVRAELAVERDPNSRIPMEHGLPGRVEIEVERVPPIELLRRLAGRAIDGGGGFELAGRPERDEPSTHSTQVTR